MHNYALYAAYVDDIRKDGHRMGEGNLEGKPAHKFWFVQIVTVDVSDKGYVPAITQDPVVDFQAALDPKWKVHSPERIGVDGLEDWGWSVVVDRI